MFSRSATDLPAEACRRLLLICALSGGLCCRFCAYSRCCGGQRAVLAVGGALGCGLLCCQGDGVGEGLSNRHLRRCNCKGRELEDSSSARDVLVGACG